MGWNVGAARGAAGIPPPVVLALQFEAVADPDGEAHSPVQAAVLPDVHEVVVGAPDCQLNAEQPCLVHVPVGQIVA